MRKDQINLANASAWVCDSKTENGIAEVPLTPIAVKAFQNHWVWPAAHGWTILDETFSGSKIPCRPIRFPLSRRRVR